MDASDNGGNLVNEMISIVLDPSPVAYIRPVLTDKGKSYAVCSADGTELAIFATQDAAFFAAKQHDLEPTLIH